MFCSVTGVLMRQHFCSCKCVYCYLVLIAFYTIHFSTALYLDQVLWLIFGIVQNVVYDLFKYNINKTLIPYKHFHDWSGICVRFACINRRLLSFVTGQSFWNSVSFGSGCEEKALLNAKIFVYKRLWMVMELQRIQQGNKLSHIMAFLCQSRKESMWGVHTTLWQFLYCKLSKGCWF